jgi:tellurite resistance protein TehA-like permease
MRLRPRELEPVPDVFAAVMATGIVSIGARGHHYRWISDALGVLATLGLLILVAVVVLAAVARRGAPFWDLTDPDITLRLFTFVAACAVLDSRLVLHPVVARSLGVIALASWLVLLVLTVRNMAACSWAALRDRAHGGWELASVGTSGLVIATTQAAAHTGQRCWLAVSVPGWVLAIAVYAVMTWLIMWRTLHERLDRDGFEPDTWILMGGAAIATLAGEHIHRLADGWPARVMLTATVATWVLATAWIPPLVYFMLRRINRSPAMLQFRGVWWALVFPLGMYSVATYFIAVELDTPSMQTVSLVFFWDALAVWLIVVIAGLCRLRRGLAR